MSPVQLPNENDEPLDLRFDRLLEQARWPEPTDDQIARLTRGWQSLSRRQRRPRYLRIAVVAAAASLLIATSLLAWRVREAADKPDLNPQLAAPQIVARPNDEAATPEPAAPIADERNKNTFASEGLSPQDLTLYEQVLVAGSLPRRQGIARTAAPRAQKHSRQARRPASQIAETNRKPASKSSPDRTNRGFGTIAALTAFAQEISTTLCDPDRCEPLLWAAIRENNNSLARSGAAELLSRVATERSLPVLAGLTTMPDTHAAAVRGLARLAPPAEIAFLASRELNAELRRVLFTALAARGTEQSVRLYLDFVARPESRREALDALADVTQPPSEFLLACLRSSDSRLRLAAAQALGRVQDPLIVEALRQSLNEMGARQETLVALLLNPSPQAAAVVDAARSDLYLVATVRAAEVELRHLANFSKR